MRGKYAVARGTSFIMDVVISLFGNRQQVRVFAAAGEEIMGWGVDGFALHSPDIGLNILAGFRLKSGLAFSAGYGLGITDAYNGGATNKNNVFNVSVSYFPLF